VVSIAAKRTATSDQTSSSPSEVEKEEVLPTEDAVVDLTGELRRVIFLIRYYHFYLSCFIIPCYRFCHTTYMHTQDLQVHSMQ
jgi:hypothetical protein